MNSMTPIRRAQSANLAREHLRQARDLLVAASCNKTVKRVRYALRSADGAVRNADSKSSRKERCQHLTGYWINKAQRNFRCYQCQCQFHIGDNLPANHPTGGIEVWRAR